MKKLLLIVSMAAICMSCTKELTQPDVQTSKTPQVSIQTSAQRTAPSVINYHYENKWNEVSYNPCTGEYVSINFDVVQTLSCIIKGDTMFYHYELHNEGTVGIGLSSGVKYTGTGHITDNLKLVYINGQWVILGSEIVSTKVIFAVPGKNNNLSSSVNYHMSSDANGNVSFTKLNFNWDYCQ